MQLGDVIEAILETENIGSYLDKGRNGVLELGVNVGYEWLKAQPGVNAGLQACEAAKQAGSGVDCEQTAKKLALSALMYAIDQAHLWPPIDYAIWIWQNTPAVIKEAIKMASKTIKLVGNALESGIKAGAQWLTTGIKTAWKVLTDPSSFLKSFEDMPIIGPAGSTLKSIITSLPGGGIVSSLPESGAIPGVDVPFIPVF